MPEPSNMSGSVQKSNLPQLADAKPESKLWRKMKEAPFVPIGVGGLLGAVTYGAVMYRRRGIMSTSVYLMHFRVIAQSMVVGAITIGVGMSVIPEIWRDYNAKKSERKS